LDVVQGAGEHWTEAYMKYDEGNAEPATQQHAKSVSGAASSAGRQAGAALTLVVNPGSSSRKYSLFAGENCLAKIHFEHLGEKIVYSTEQNSEISAPSEVNISHLTFASSKVLTIFKSLGLLESTDQIQKIALRVVAPSSYFQQDRLIDGETLKKLEALEPRALLHINADLQEIHSLKKQFAGAKIIGVSDSAFHTAIPDSSANYGLPLKDAEKLDIKRFGYHGLSVESAVAKLKKADRLAKRVVVCHLGSGASITALRNGKSVHTTMGYSPLEGLLMATRSGDVDITAVQVLQKGLGLDNHQLQSYLNEKSGLLGVSGVSSDIRELLKSEGFGNPHAKLALKMYVLRIQKAIGAASAVLGGLDTLVFTGVVGERSYEIRKRVVSKLMFLGLTLDAQANHQTVEPREVSCISPPHHPAKVLVVPTDEDSEIVKHANKI
jgi:acetate kinase